jgi:leucyl aminopeptidase (aminopeptidase T)
MSKSAEIVLKKCLDLKKNERILIITDSKLYSIGKMFFEQAKKITDSVKLVKVPIPKVSGTEPSKKIAREMLKYDVELLVTAKSLSHTKARKNACEKGARIVTMPGATKGMLKRALDIDYKRLKGRNKKLMKILTRGKIAKITTKKGTNLVMGIKGRKCFDDNGIYNKKGSFGNLPSGEVAVAPIEETTNGVYVIDASLSGVGKLKKELKIKVEDGYAIGVEGEKAKQLKKYFKSREHRNIAEFGIGTNPKAKVSGCVLEDEKVIGTVHIALGNNISLGGKVNVPLHLDGVIKNPTVYVDNKKIMSNGRLII